MTGELRIGARVVMKPEFVALGYPAVATIVGYSPCETDQWIVSFGDGWIKRVHFNSIREAF